MPCIWAFLSILRRATFSAIWEILSSGEFVKLLKQLACHVPSFSCSASCAVGPNYERPDVSSLTPTDWRWKVAEPKEAIPKGEWWKIFNDPVLDELETEAVASNQNLRAAVARVDEARAAARVSLSQFFPEVSLDPSYKRERTSGHLPTPIPINVPSALVDTYSVPFDLSYEVDLWGRVRRSFEASQAQAQASVADYQNVLLTLTADLAVNYFLVRSLDAEIAALRRTVELRNESVRILNGRFVTGVIPEMDVAQAKTELASAEAELVDMIRQRAETLNAVALLCGRPASSFEIAERPATLSPPAVPAGLPSALLERRPDIAHAERNLAAKNAQIGVARAAYFPVAPFDGAGRVSERRCETSLLKGQLCLVCRAKRQLAVVQGGADRRRGQASQGRLRGSSRRLSSSRAHRLQRS